MTNTQHSLNSKVALITGGAKRIGAAIATTLHNAGMDLVVHFRHSAADAQSLADELNDTRPNSVVLAEGDLENSEDEYQIEDKKQNIYMQKLGNPPD